MSAIDEILAAIPMDQLASRLGVDPDTAQQAARTALPGLLGGMEANAKDPAGAASLTKALDQHDGGLVDGGVDLDQVDEADGDKIVGHVFGDNREQVVDQLASATGGGAGSDMIGKLLPMLAPIAMAFLAKKLQGGGGSAAVAGGGGGGGIGDLIGSVLGGGGGGGLDIGGMLGGLLGGGRR